MRLLQNPTSDRVPDPGAGVPASSFPAAEAGPVAQAVATARAAMAAAREGDLKDQPVDDLAVLVQALSGLEAEASALLGDVLGEAERRQVADAEAATGTDAWAAALTGQSREVLAGGARIAELLRSKYHHAREAYATGAPVSFNIIDSSFNEDGKPVIVWESVQNIIYAIDMSYDLNEWLEITDDLIGQAGTTPFVDEDFEDGTARIFYRIRTQ